MARSSNRGELSDKESSKTPQFAVRSQVRSGLKGALMDRIKRSARLRLLMKSYQRGIITAVELAFTSIDAGLEPETAYLFVIRWTSP